MNVVNVVPMRPSSPELSSSTPTHVPVLRAEVLRWLDPEPGRRYLDATVGAGGHSAALLEVEGTEVIAADRDPAALSAAQRRLRRFGARVVLRHACFSELGAVLRELDVERVDGIVADLGLSSMQLADPGRGMSFRLEGPIDMRMDPSRGETARDLIERLSSDELSEIIFRLGDERRARRVARCIKQACLAGQLATTLDLRRAVVQAVGPARIGGIDPATRTFQALRMAVNGELAELQALLEGAAQWLAPGGRVVVISFHSLEDRVTKRVLSRQTTWQLLTSKPVTPTPAEMDQNPRARSAKLRAARRVELTAVQENGG
jgi:16S rRNA (cytosine1402-N4)-methyltransferase